MRVLNLYAGIGGNRKLWGNVEVTAVESNKEIAGIYKHFFPNDTLIIGDAHEYLLRNFREFDFIWSSPPCQSHSRIRQFVGVNAKGFELVYPKMELYQEIILLTHNCKTKWIVENVNPYYEPLIKPSAKLGRHFFWANFDIPHLDVKAQNLRTKNKIEQVAELHDFDLSAFKVADKRQILRNCVDAEIGQHIFSQVSDSAAAREFHAGFTARRKEEAQQIGLFI